MLERVIFHAKFVFVFSITKTGFLTVERVVIGMLVLIAENNSFPKALRIK
jgi:hypothetical protein